MIRTEYRALICIANTSFKLRCDTRFQREFTASGCVFKVITLVGANNVINLKMQPHAVNAR